MIFLTHIILDVLNHIPIVNGPRHANLVLIAYASSEGSGEPAHPRSLARTSAARSTSSESRGTFRQKARSLASLNGWACAVKICHDGMLEDTNSLDEAQLMIIATSHKCNTCTGYKGIQCAVVLPLHRIHILIRSEKFENKISPYTTSLVTQK